MFSVKYSNLFKPLVLSLALTAGFFANGALAEGPKAQELWDLYYDEQYAEALAGAMPLAESGDADAQTILGLLYEFGLGVTADKTLAAQWYKKGADGGNTTAALGYGYLNYVGEGVPQDYQIAFTYLSQAAIEEGEAAFYLGEMYEDGLGVEQSRDFAITWYQISDQLGYTDAPAALARLGVGTDDSDGGLATAEPGLDPAYAPCKALIGEWKWFSGGKGVFDEYGTFTYVAADNGYSLTRSWSCTSGDSEKTAQAKIVWNQIELFSGYEQEIAIKEADGDLFENGYNAFKSSDPLGTRL